MREYNKGCFPGLPFFLMEIAWMQHDAHVIDCAENKHTRHSAAVLCFFIWTHKHAPLLAITAHGSSNAKFVVWFPSNYPEWCNRDMTDKRGHGQWPWKVGANQDQHHRCLVLIQLHLQKQSTRRAQSSAKAERPPSQWGRIFQKIPGSRSQTSLWW